MRQRHRGCNCINCRMTKAEKAKRYRERLNEQLRANPESFEHPALHTYYNAGCRCEKCTALASTAAKRWMNEEAAPDHYRRMRQGSLDNWRSKGYQRDDAPNRRKPWTDEEMTYATETDEDGNYLRTATLVGEMLGRTKVAVMNARIRARRSAATRPNPAVDIEGLT